MGVLMRFIKNATKNNKRKINMANYLENRRNNQTNASLHSERWYNFSPISQHGCLKKKLVALTKMELIVVVVEQDLQTLK